MAKILDMPKLSPTMEEGVLTAWHKKEGDAVAVDDLLAEVETDKATMEFRAFDKGTILKILVAPGTQVKLGQPVAVLGDPGEDVSALVKEHGGGGDAPKADAKGDAGSPEKQAESKPSEDSQKQEQPKQEAAPKDASKEKEDTHRAPPTLTPPAPEKPVRQGGVLDRASWDAGPASAERAAKAEGRVLASPFVRQSARDLGIDLSGATGSGPGGRVLPADLESLKTRSSQPPATQSAPLARANGNGNAQHALAVPGLAPPEERPLSPMRKTIARRLSESKRTVPHFYLTIDVDAGALSDLRETINLELAKGVKQGKSESEPGSAQKISINDLLVKACAAALVRVPECNAQFAETSILVHRRVDISVAVAIPDGLVTPVVRNADQKSVVAIAHEIRDLAARARAKKLKPEEMTDGTFSISNLGMFGIDNFSAVINPPEGAILAVGRVREEPIVKDGQISAGKRLSMTLSCDHRVIDGAVGASFLAELRALLEHPMRVLTG